MTIGGKYPAVAIHGYGLLSVALVPLGAILVAVNLGGLPMVEEPKASIQLEATGAAPDIVFEATEGLLREINEEFRSPVATRPLEKATPGAKGDLVTVGQIVLALISAGVTKQIAQVLITHAKCLSEKKLSRVSHL